MTWKEYYRHYLQELQQIYSPGEAAAVTTLIFENKTGIKRSDIIISPDITLTQQQKEILDKALLLLLQHIPVQQVTGEAWFYDLLFSVNEHVLIPRPETEELVQWILAENTGTVSVLDIGSGSGCIAIALKKNLPSAIVTAVDISPEALTIAKKNAASNNTDINFIELDFLNEHNWQQLAGFDIIVSNPPYIPMHEKEKMDTNVTAHEPPKALFVPDDRPLIFYEKITAFAKLKLNVNGKVYAEIHEDLSNETAAVFSSGFDEVEIKKDINGKYRMIKATRSR